jgi:5'(3')-deoxyribonucleotidase
MLKIYLDVDGVLVNFRKGVHEAFDQPYDYDNLPLSWFFWKSWGITNDKANAVCEEDFWAELSWMHDGREILAAVCRTALQCHAEIYLLTTPMPNNGSWSGKAEWLDYNMPMFKRRVIMTNVDKSIFADAHSLLIDDKDSNVEGFVAAGGYGLLVPRPWNKDAVHASETLNIVTKRLETI